MKISPRWPDGSEVYITNLSSARQKMAVNTRFQMHRQAMERRHLIVLKSGARGHRSAQRLAIQLRIVNAKLARLLREFEIQRGPQLHSESFVWDDVKDPGSGFYLDLEVPLPAAVSYTTMKEAVYAINMVSRSHEELAALVLEIRGLMAYYGDLHSLLADSFQSETSAGRKAFMLHSLLDNETKQLLVANVARKAFQLVLPIEDVYRTHFLLSGSAAEVVEDTVEGNFDGLDLSTHNTVQITDVDCIDDSPPSDNEFNMHDIDDDFYI